MPTLVAYQEQLKDWIANNLLEKVAESVVDRVDASSGVEANNCRNEAINALSRLRTIGTAQRTGQLSFAEYQLELNKIRPGLNSIVDDLREEWLKAKPDQSDQRLHRAIGQRQPDRLDHVFKLLMLLLCLLSIGLFIFTMTLLNRPLVDKLPHMVLSIVGGSGAFYGYMKWRLIELQTFHHD